eukprot:TRINITY_DN203_c1_g1_i5.p1 TRINITY_DN203_c1_g1~~TRINITY_DN203_c1_g1_i5.p1  ORF type:complete len:107 (-),score=30.71 TRINITY_DN203_c1_g1_i5:38-358(-)
MIMALSQAHLFAATQAAGAAGCAKCQMGLCTDFEEGLLSWQDADTLWRLLERSLLEHDGAEGCHYHCVTTEVLLCGVQGLPLQGRATPAVLPALAAMPNTHATLAA